MSSLTYTTTETRTVEVKRTITPYKDWGMFSKRGNQSIEKKAVILLDEVKEILKPENGFVSYTQKLKPFRKFVKSFRGMCKKKSFVEASDTAVRESVWHFMVKVGEVCGIDTFTLDDIWDEIY